MRTRSTFLPNSLGFPVSLGCAAAVALLVACGDSTTTASGGTGGVSSTSTGEQTTTSGTTTSTTTTSTTSVSTTSTSSSLVTTGSGSGGGGGALTCTGNQPATNITGPDCDLLDQNCTGNTTCAAVDDGKGGTTTGCVVDAGLKGIGQPCAQDTECTKGLLCLADTCAPICCPGTGKPCGDGECNTQFTIGTGADAPYFFGCTFAPACTLFTANACANGDICQPSAEPNLATCNKQNSPPVAEGGACTFFNDCGDMQGCFSSGSNPGVCRYVCKLGSSAAAGLGGCPANQTCGADSDLGSNLGVCSP